MALFQIYCGCELNSEDQCVRPPTGWVKCLGTHPLPRLSGTQPLSQMRPPFGASSTLEHCSSLGESGKESRGRRTGEGCFTTGGRMVDPVSGASHQNCQLSATTLIGLQGTVSEPAIRPPLTTLPCHRTLCLRHSVSTIQSERLRDR